MKKALPAMFTLLLVCAPRCAWSQVQPSTAATTQAGCQGDSSNSQQGCGPQSNASDSGDSYGESGTIQRSDAAENAPLHNRQTNRGPDTALPPEDPTEFQSFVAATTGQKLPIYGASLFHRVPSTFAPSDLTPVSADYVIGPDDELRVRLWGAPAYSGNLRVDRSGRIFIPQVGSVEVAGLKFVQLDQHLRAAVAREYSNFDLSVELGRIRSIQVYVTGQARRPGAYTVSSMSSLVNALFASGGPSPQGSMRHLELRREGKTVANFDLYALLLHGDKSADARLEAEDVLYIPAAGAQVAILGSVRNPAIYELSDHETLGGMLKSAGGTTALSSQARISVDRAGQDGHRETIEFAFDAVGQTAALIDGDIARIEPTIPAYRNTVTLRGNVANPGHFSWRAGMRLSDIIPDRDSLVSRDYWWQRAHLALPSPEFESDVIKPQPLMQELKRSIENPAEENAQRLGAAALNAEQTTSHASLAAETAVTGEGGSAPPKVEVRLLAHEIDWDYAVIERTDLDSLKTSLIAFDLGKLVLSRDESQNLSLQPGDTITIFSQDDIHLPIDEQTKYVTVDGEVRRAGTYSAKPSETLQDIIVRAGGLTPKAYLYGSELTRESARQFQQRRIDEYVQQVDLEMRRGSLAVANYAITSGTVMAPGTSAQDRFLERLKLVRASGRVVLQLQPSASSIDALPTIELENGDHFTVPAVPETVNVVGAVYNENVFLYHRGLSAQHYLKLAGGATRNADIRRMFIIRADGSVDSREDIKGLWGDAFFRTILNPGDSLVIPEKILKPNTSLKTFLDYSQAFSQLSIGAVAIAVLR